MIIVPGGKKSGIGLPFGDAERWTEAKAKAASLAVLSQVASAIMNRRK